MIVPLDAIDAAPSAGRHLAATATHNTRTQVHAAFDVQDTEAWSNADDLRTPSEVKAELARLRQLALACVTAKMDNKKVNDKIDLNAPKKAAVYKAPLVREAIARCLSSNPLFKRCRPEEKEELLGQFEKVQFTKGSTIIKQGDEGATFYVVEDGTCIDPARIKEISDKRKTENEVKKEKRKEREEALLKKEKK